MGRSIVESAFDHLVGPFEGTQVNNHATTRSPQVACSPNGNLLASCGYGKHIKILKSETMELLHTYDA